MPNLSTILATIGALALWVVCMVHAWRQAARCVAIMICASIFGLIVEYADMRMMHAYHYEQFPVMIFGTVPLMIVLSWGAIMYSVMQTSDHLRLHWFLKPVYDGLLALTIDLSLDPVAIQLGYWVWTDPNEKSPPWFGAPFANYYGWYMVVFWFSLVIRAGFRWLPPARHGWRMNIIIPAVAIPVSMIPFWISLFFYGSLMMFVKIPEPIIFSVLLGLNLLSVLWFLPQVPHNAPLDTVSLSVPLFFHGFLILMLFGSGLFLKPEGQALVILVPTIAAFSLICFSWPYLDNLNRLFQRFGQVLAGPQELALEQESPPKPPAPNQGAA